MRIGEVKIGGDLPPLAATEENKWVGVKLWLDSFRQVTTNELDGREKEPDWKSTTFAEMAIGHDDAEESEVPHWCLKDLYDLIGDYPTKKKTANLRWRRTTFQQGDKQLNAGEWSDE